MIKHLKIYTATLTALVVTAAPYALSQAALEEVVVTAERRAQSLQDVPMSVSALTGDQLAEQGIVSMEDITAHTPNFTMNQYGVGQPQLFLRGIGSTIDSAAADPSVAVFIDDVYMSRAAGATGDLFDLERVEILRGPQGTLYGKNVVGGAVSFITNKPDEETTASLSGTYGTYRQADVRGNIRGPLTDKLFGGIAVSSRNRDGYAKNLTTGGELEDLENNSVRATLRALPSDSLEVILSGDYAQRRGNGYSFMMDPAVGFLAPLKSKDPRKRRHAVDAGNGQQNRDMWGGSATVVWTGDQLTFKSITAYRDTAYDAFLDVAGAEFIANDYSSFPLRFNSIQDEQSKQFTQEFRLSGDTDSLNWVAGLYYLNDDTKRLEIDDQSFQAPLVPEFLGVVPNYDSVDQHSETKSYAVFGQATYTITDHLNATVGARWSRDDRSFTNEVIGEGDGPFFVDESKSWSEPTFRLSLDYAFSDNMMAYLTYSEGYKSGGYNGQPASLAGGSTPFAPEYAENYETGIRSDWFDNRVRANLTGFYIDYTDLQVSQLLDTDNNPNTLPVITIGNAGEAVSKGVELELSAALTEKFAVDVNYSYLDASITGELSNESGVDLKGNKLSRSPENTLSVTAAYTVATDHSGEFTLRAHYAFKDDYYFSLGNLDYNRQASNALVDLSVTWRSPNQTWEVQAWGKNVTDELYSVQSIPFLGSGFPLYGAPRTAGVTVNWNL